jgi:predicted GIY-YIG superfamily endonuclease
MSSELKWEPFTGYEVFFVYRLLSKTGEIVYIGITMDLNVRIRRHRKKLKFKSVEFSFARRTLKEALEIEKAEIRKHKPKYNKNGYGVSAKIRRLYQMKTKASPPMPDSFATCNPEFGTDL